MPGQSQLKNRTPYLIFVFMLIVAPIFGISESDQPSAPTGGQIQNQTEQSLSTEQRQILQHEIKVLIEQRRSMVEEGAKPADIQEISEKIQNKTRALSSQPPLVSNMTPDLQKNFDKEFLIHRAKLEKLGKSYQALLEKKAPKEEVEAVVKEINDARTEMQQFLQTFMQPNAPQGAQQEPGRPEHLH